MPRYRYKSIGPDGKPSRGRVTADSVEGALAQLAAQGLTVSSADLELDPGKPADQASLEVAERIGMVAEAGLPMASTLRAVATEMPSEELAERLRRLAERVEAGEPLDQAMVSLDVGLPAHLRAVILAGVRTGSLPEATALYGELCRERAEMRWRLRLSMIYPVFLLLGVFLLFNFLGWVVIPEFRGVFEEFGAELPQMTQCVLAMPVATGWTVAVAAVLVIQAVLLWRLPWPSWMVRLAYFVPIFGPLTRWMALSEFTGLMELMLRQRIPLPEALRLTAAAVHSRTLGQACRRAADRAEAGVVGIDCFTSEWQFPRSLRPLLGWSFQSEEPAEGFRTASRLYRQRARTHAGLWEVLASPIMLVCVGIAVGFIVIALFLPLISLIQNLTGGGY